MQENIQEKVTIEVTTNQESEKKPTNKKMTIFNFILIISICVGLLVYMIVVDGVDNMIKVLFMVDYKWVLAGLGCLLLQWFCDGVNLNIAIKKLYPDQKLLNSLRVAIIGQLFNNITPFSTGGQPMQAYELSKTGKRVSDSLSAMMMKFVINQTALVVSTIVVMAFEIRFFINLMQNYLWVAILGFSVEKDQKKRWKNCVKV